MTTNTGHVLLINNSNSDPHIFLIQETNEHWGIFGGRQEKYENSLTETAVRELREESLGSLQGIPRLFSFLDYYDFYNKRDKSHHQTFVVIDSRIKQGDIRVDIPGNQQGFGDIKKGEFFPLYLVLEAIYAREKFFMYNNTEHKLRYFFAETVRRNKEFLEQLFDPRNISAMEARHRLLNISPVVSRSTLTTAKRAVIGGVPFQIA